MNTEQRIINREQLSKCFIDLGERAAELKENDIASISLMLAASIMEGSDAALGVWCREFAKIRVNELRKYLEETENDGEEKSI